MENTTAGDPFRDFVETTTEWVWAIDGGGILTYNNPAVEKILGYTPAELANVSFLSLIDVSERAVVEEKFQRFVRARSGWNGLVLHWRHKDGSSRFLESNGIPVLDDSGVLVGFRGADRDITEQRHTLAALRESERRFRDLFDNAPVGYHEIDVTGRYVRVNRTELAMLGYKAEEMIGHYAWEFVEDEVSRSATVAKLSGELSPGPFERTFRRKDGSLFTVLVEDCLIRDTQGQPCGIRSTLIDITERKRDEERFKTLAYHDPLTGVPNRLLFSDRLAMAVAQAHRQGHAVAVLFLDLDRFKLINDSFGHSFGDRLLHAVAERLEASVRQGDTVARFGGDEFTLMLPGVTRTADVTRIAEKVLEGLKQPFRMEGREVLITASMGVALYPDDGLDVESLVQNADAAMYRAKAQGRDNFQLYAPLRDDPADRGALAAMLRRALEQDELLVYYQPLFDVPTRRVHSVEALLRWRHPQRGLIGPSDFIALAEATGQILEIGAWVLDKACAQVKSWHDDGYRDLQLSVNLSARQFQQPEIAERVRGALASTGLPPAALCLEIAEANALKHGEATVHVMRDLKEVGVTLALDDFGLGQSSALSLKRLPIDVLKIDPSVVGALPQDSNEADVTAAMIGMAHHLKLSVVAEGVETAAQMNFLAERQCDRLQGFYLSRPLSAEECGLFLHRHGRGH